MRYAMNKILLLFLLPIAVHAQPLRLTLDDCIALARKQSVDAAVDLGELKSAYWQWRSYKADLLPEVSFSATLPSYNKRYNSYQQADGGVSYVRNDYLGMDGSLYISQKIWPTGGTLSVETSLDFLHQSGKGGGNQFMSMPVALTLSQPIFGVNHQKWNRRIEPLRYREAQARFLSDTEGVAMKAISLFFNLILAGEQVGIARQNLQKAEELYKATRRNMRAIRSRRRTGRSKACLHPSCSAVRSDGSRRAASHRRRWRVSLRSLLYGSATATACTRGWSIRSAKSPTASPGRVSSSRGRRD